jgi:predicted AlkP superfamily pyrophosphatase or phosphodiesterase
LSKTIPFLFALALAVHAERLPVVLISIDGLRPDCVLKAAEYGLKIPNLRRMVSGGAYATAVHGVLPTVTYPSHTTLVTGVSPARHGIYANTTFDPANLNYGGWYWYAEDIKVPTLWDEAGKAGLTTANVHWPVTVGAKIDWNLAQYWRASTPDDRKLLRALSTPGLLDLLERDLPPYADGGDESLAGDQRRALFAVRLIELKRPAFMTVYFASLDHVEHQSGPFSTEANGTLEQLDALVGAVRDAAGTGTVVAVVSDHGFVRIRKDVNLLTEFVTAGLISLDDSGKVKSWQATVWGAGASGAVMLNPDAPAGTRERVAALLERVSKDPANGIQRVLGAGEVKRLGGFPGAAFVVGLQPGYSFGARLTGPLIADSSLRGMHGYLPELADMDSTFLIAGPGIPAGRSLGAIDMRDIAPTLASILGVRLTKAEGHDVLAGK